LSYTGTPVPGLEPGTSPVSGVCKLLLSGYVPGLY